MPNDSERALAIFVDFDNIAQGFRRTDRFDIQRVLKRMVEKGKIVAKKTYADWSRYIPYTASLHEAAFELVEIPKRSMTGKNSADIRLCVDAMDLAYNKPHIDTFVIVSGDSDFTPLVSKLKEMGKHVIGLGMTNSTSELLRDNCDEFIYYEDLEVEKAEAPKVNLPVPDTKRKALELLMEACTALRRENKEVLWASMIKETMKRKKPSFNETYHGFNTFSALLEDAQSQGLVELERDAKRGTYTVVRFGEELTGAPPKKEATREYTRGARGREPLAPSTVKRAPLAATPHRRAPLSAKPGKSERHERTSRSARDVEPERTAPLAARFIEPEIKPRVAGFQGFNDFEQETTQFLGKRPAPSFEDEFSSFGTPFSRPLSATAGEVMAGIAHDARSHSARPPVPPPPPPELVEEELVHPDAKPTDNEDKDQYKKRRRRSTKGKDRDSESSAEPVEAPKIDDRPIFFDDVPFMAPKPPAQAEEAAPVFHDWTPEQKPEPQQPKHHRPKHDQQVEKPAPRHEEPAPVVTKPPVRDFGFGIFDE
ncbi:MAG TPA: NYN domain-containing protein [Gemmatales bacterium]|nr:NYN domain-containing protein [Gemmatales bacterium]